MYEYVKEGYCPVCEAEATFRAEREEPVPPQFLYGFFRGALKCQTCESIPRERSLAHVLNKYRPNWRQLKVHECSPGGRMSGKLWRETEDYTPTQYDPDIPWGERASKKGYQSENLEALTFQDDTFDLFVAQDVFEHIMFPDAAAKEIGRTLRPGGMCIMTFPAVRHSEPSRRRARLGADGEIEHILEAQYHGNPMGGGSLVTIDWGWDVGGYFAQHSGLATSILLLDNESEGIHDKVNLVLIAEKQALTNI